MEKYDRRSSGRKMTVQELFRLIPVFLILGGVLLVSAGVDLIGVAMVVIGAVLLMIVLNLTPR